MMIDDISTQIKLLQDKKDEIIRNKYSVNDEEISKLEWTKHHRARFLFDSIYYSDKPRYAVDVLDNPPEVDDTIIVHDEKDYFKNVFYGRAYNVDCGRSMMKFYSYDRYSMIKFLESIKFAELLFDQDDLDTLTKVADIARSLRCD